MFALFRTARRIVRNRVRSMKAGLVPGDKCVSTEAFRWFCVLQEVFRTGRGRYKLRVRYVRVYGERQGTNTSGTLAQRYIKSA